MMIQYFISRNGRDREGPYSLQGVQAMFASGQLSPRHLVWHEGLSSWVKAGSLPELATPAMPPPPGAGAVNPVREPPPRAAAAAPAWNPPPRRGDSNDLVGTALARGSYGGAGRRFVAALIDAVVLAPMNYGASLMVARAAVLALRGSREQLIQMLPSIEIAAQLVGLLIAIMYVAILESSSWQATLGKRAMGLTVTTLNGGGLSFPNAFGRGIGRFVLGPLTLGIGYLMIFFSDRKQALHDRIAGTLVVRVR